jgi:hypothetical protein
MVFRIQLTQSIAYAERSRHRLDVCRPRDAVAAPVIIFFYGGDWQSGYKELYRYVAKALARRGYVGVVPDYRILSRGLLPRFPRRWRASGVPIPKFAGIYGALVRTSESIRTLASLSWSAAFESEVRIGGLRKVVRTSGSRH